MSGTHAYGGDCPGMESAYHYGGGGLGILGSLIVAGGFIAASISMPGDANKEYYGLITSIPAGLTIDTGEGGDFEASALDGSYVVPWDLYESGVKLGSTTFTNTFGSGSVISLAPANLSTASTLSTASVTVTPAAAGTINLVAANLSSAGTLSTASVGVVPTYVGAVVNLTIASLTTSSTLSTASVGVTLAAAGGTAPYVSPSRIVNFDGGTNRVAFYGGTNRVNF